MKYSRPGVSSPLLSLRTNTDQNVVLNKMSRIRDQEVVEEMLSGDTRVDAAKETMRKMIIEAIRGDLRPRY